MKCVHETRVSEEEEEKMSCICLLKEERAKHGSENVEQILQRIMLFGFFRLLFNGDRKNVKR